MCPGVYVPRASTHVTGLFFFRLLGYFPKTTKHTNSYNGLLYENRNQVCIPVTNLEDTLNFFILSQPSSASCSIIVMKTWTDHADTSQWRTRRNKFIPRNTKQPSLTTDSSSISSHTYPL